MLRIYEHKVFQDLNNPKVFIYVSEVYHNRWRVLSIDDSKLKFKDIWNFFKKGNAFEVYLIRMMDDEIGTVMPFEYLDYRYIMDNYFMLPEYSETTRAVRKTLAEYLKEMGPLLRELRHL